MDHSEEFEFMLHQYDGANARRANNFTFVWQAAALSLTALAFLMTITLSGGTSQVGRTIASSLAILASWAALALMHSQKQYQEVESAWLDMIELKHQPESAMRHAGRPRCGSNVHGIIGFGPAHLLIPHLRSKKTFRGSN